MEEVTLAKKKKKKKTKSKRRISYNQFVFLAQNFDYFPNDRPERYAEFAPRIREIIVRELEKSPLEENEIYKLLKRYNPTLSDALEYIFQKVEMQEDDSGIFSRALETISKGIEIRSKGIKDYWGLASKLDKA